MATNKMLIEERTRDIGSFLVGRLLPVREKRQIGPFTFVDHMGPVKVKPGQYFDIDQHPHIGLSTLTYLLEGSIQHRDSTGADCIIGAGDVGFMTAGKAVAHTERTPVHLRESDKEYTMHGYQIWVAMPKEKEDMEPRFDFVSKDDLPKWNASGLEFILVAGKGYGYTSSLPVHSDLFMLDVKSTTDTFLDVKDKLEGEIGIIVIQGGIESDGELIGKGSMMISKTEDECRVNVKSDSRLLVFGGQALPEKRYLYWNFVSSNRDKIDQAKEMWENKEFPKVPGDNTYIPLPKK
jgi:redox-sensitive bicupin YhaK (pirin superfamily)